MTQDAPLPGLFEPRSLNTFDIFSLAHRTLVSGIVTTAVCQGLSACLLGAALTGERKDRSEDDAAAAHSAPPISA